MSGRAYLSIVGWPRGWGEGRRVESLVMAAGLDPDTAASAIQREPPMIVGALDSVIIDEVIRVLHDDGVLALAPSLDELVAQMPAERVKSLFRFEDQPEPVFGFEPWRGEPGVVRAEEFVLLVRASPQSRSVKLDVDRQAMRGSGGLFQTAWMGQAGVGVNREERLHQSELLDLFVRTSAGDARRLRFDGAKFNFNILGELRGYGDKENMDKLMAILAAGAPDARVDQRFGSFRMPTDVVTRVGPDNHTRIFDFYTGWLWVLEQRMGG